MAFSDDKRKVPISTVPFEFSQAPLIPTEELVSSRHMVLGKCTHACNSSDDIVHFTNLVSELFLNFPLVFYRDQIIGGCAKLRGFIQNASEKIMMLLK